MKIRLFVTPPNAPATLLELDLPDGAAPATLRAFTPPPSAGEDRSVARTIPVDAETVAALATELEAVRIVPFGSPPAGSGPAAELVLTEGQAEARIQWWIGAPGGWEAADRVVRTLAGLAGLPMG